MSPLSLRRRLLLWLIVPLGIMAVALVTEAYLSARASTEKVHDELLVATALGISEHVVGTDGDLVPSEIMALLATSTNEKTYYLITGQNDGEQKGIHSGCSNPVRHPDSYRRRTGSCLCLGGDWPWAGTTGDAARGHYQAIIP